MSQEFARVRERAVDIALYEMSQIVQEVGSENRGPRIDRYATRSRSGLSLAEGVAGRDWCRFFIYWCYAEAARFYGQTLPFLVTDLWAGQRVYRWAHANTATIVLAGDIEPGDIYVAPNNHIGMAIASMSDPTLFKSIDGNQSTGNSGRSAITENVRHVNNCRVIVRI